MEHESALEQMNKPAMKKSLSHGGLEVVQILLLFVAAFFLSQPRVWGFAVMPQHASGNRILENVSLWHDASIRVILAYDGVANRSLAYDESSTLNAPDKEKAAVGERSHFADFVKTVAAETTTLETTPLKGVQLNKVIGDTTSDAIASRYPAALREVPFDTVGGTRISDVVPLDGSNIAIESKVGLTSLDSRIRQELARDWWLARQGQVNTMWEFTPSPITGEVGPTSALLQKLQKLQIPYKINQ